MKKLFLLLSAVLLTASCSNDDDFSSGNGAGNLGSVNFKVHLNYDTTHNDLVVGLAEVVLTNTETGDIYNASSATNGVASFTNILPGSYSITATKTMSNLEYADLFGFTPTTEQVIFNGNQQQVIVNANVTSTSLVLRAARMGDLVIKQIYYAGSSTTQGALFRDQFIEIYNNSNEVIYADGLYIAQLYGKTNRTVQSFTLPSGQFDWNQSLEMPFGTTNANTNYVYSDYVIQIPGNGTQYPIQPGESMVIAQNAQNHQAPLVDNNGEPISINNPALTIDLSAATFEVYLGDWGVSVGRDVYVYDIQNPAVPDMNIAYWGRPGWYNGNKDFLMDNPGRDSFVIFHAEDFASYANFSDPSVTVIDNNTRFFLQIPTAVIIDGVDLQHFNANSQRPKMLPSAIDASEISCDASFNSQSVIRKIKQTTASGRVILEDTNNSAADFVKLAKADPYGFAH